MSTTNSKPAKGGPVQFTKEVRTELKRVVWPTRTEVLQYSVVVTIVCIVIALMVFGLDAVFGKAALWIFS